MASRDMEKNGDQDAESTGKDWRVDRFEDLSGVRCPLNYAKTKMHLSAMDSGQILEIILDAGPPVRNVPGSVQQEGHTVLCQEKHGDQWRVVIQKA
ncbi:MAG: sulfurtransferase TusA family protein [Candidatus Electrothrix sp. GW3-4]|uniref:sulfurtransferase TusA family protein n=1 Tax=Candidatus Electrothrix sp. GW3-4 TaxID=3126740 RepID=UPI0030D2FF70